MKRFTISGKNLPVRPPLNFTIVMALLLDRLQADGWILGAAGTLLALLWICYFISKYSEEPVDLFK